MFHRRSSGHKSFLDTLCDRHSWLHLQLDMLLQPEKSSCRCTNSKKSLNFSISKAGKNNKSYNLSRCQIKQKPSYLVDQKTIPTVTLPMIISPYIKIRFYYLLQTICKKGIIAKKICIEASSATRRV